MNEETRYEELRKIVQTYLPEDVSLDSVSKESHLINELNINSAHLVDIVLDVEDAFDIQFENEDMDKMHTIGNAMDIIADKIAAK